MTNEYDRQRKSGNPFEALKMLDPQIREAIQYVRDGKTRDIEGLDVIQSAVMEVALAILRKRHVRNATQEAEDIGSQFCEILLETGLRTYDARKPFGRYGAQIIVNLCNGFGRRARVRKASSLECDVADAKVSVTACVEASMIRRKMRPLVARLPRHLRRTMIAKYWLDLTAREGAVRLGISDQQFDQRAFRARALLRKWYGPQGWLHAA
jgi:RNA polymerase sigma factor (sigma-70 family)